MFEHFSEPLLTRKQFAFRLLRQLGYILNLVALSLLIGICGYHFLEAMPWIDALLNASMILGGMGPVDALHTTAGKIFASLYALYSGLLLIGFTGLLLAPIIHRLLHLAHDAAHAKK